jgi:hypothetical protein
MNHLNLTLHEYIPLICARHLPAAKVTVKACCRQHPKFCKSLKTSILLATDGWPRDFS